MTDYLLVWVFTAFFNAKPAAIAFYGPDARAKCNAARTSLEAQMVEDGDDDGDWIAGECKPFTLVEPRGRIQ